MHLIKDILDLAAVFYQRASSGSPRPMPFALVFVSNDDRRPAEEVVISWIVGRRIEGIISELRAKDVFVNILGVVLIGRHGSHLVRGDRLLHCRNIGS